MPVPSIDQALGLKVYASKTPGISGAIREEVEDFLVQEVLVDSAVASNKKQTEYRALGATYQRQNYLLCVLLKRNWDTLSAVMRIAKELGISQNHIQIAGIKDARAVTAQHITIEGAAVEQVSRIRIPGVELLPIGYFRDGLAPFYLLGNKFRVRIKGIKHRKTALKRIAETVSELDNWGGIPNFFGHQRFGTKRPITHMVGKSIVKGDFEGAALLFLTQTSEHEHPESRQVRNELRSTQDFKQALKDFPRRLRYERVMLSQLVADQKDFVGAFGRLPPKLQELFVQAYQSFLFNLFLSERLEHGFSLNKAEPGDFVVNLDRFGLPISKTGKTVGTDSLAATNELVKAGKTRVALPLIGTGQKTSDGDVGEIQREILEMEGVEPRNFRIGALRIMSGKGGLRSVVSPLKEFRVQSASSIEEDSKEREVELSFMLLRGSYATMLLREVMKPKDPISSGF